MNKHRFLYILFLFYLSQTFSQSVVNIQEKKTQRNVSLKTKLTALINSDLKDVFSGIKIVNLDDGKVLFEQNANKLFRPASAQKLITTIAALELLPENFLLKTEIYSSSELLDTVLEGDLYVKGYGDPLFEMRHLDSIVNYLLSRNIKSINGNLIGDISYFDDEFWGRGWMWDDEPEAFVAFISPLSINSNSLKLTVMPAEKVNEPASVKIYPENDFVRIHNKAYTSTEDDTINLKITRSRKIRSNDIYIEGKIPLKSYGKEYFVSIWKPEEFFMFLFRESLEKNGIKVNGNILIDTITFGKPLINIYHSLDTVVSNINKYSNNLASENLFKVISAEIFKSRGNAKASVTLVNRILSKIGIDTNKIVVADGSGVSRYNLNSPENFIKIIKYYYDNDKDKFEKIYNSLAVAGKEGTLRNRFRNVKGSEKIRAKTGTHSDATALVGFCTNRKNKLISYCIMINNFPPGNTNNINNYKKLEEKIVKLISES